MQIYIYKKNETIYLNHNDYDDYFYLIFPKINKINNKYVFNVISWDKYDDVNIYENIINYNDIVDKSNENYKNGNIFCKINDTDKISNKIYDWYQKSNNKYYIKIDYNENNLDNINYIIDFLRSQTIFNYLTENKHNFYKLNFNNFHTENDLNENIKLNMPKNKEKYNIKDFILGLIKCIPLIKNFIPNK